MDNPAQDGPKLYYVLSESGDKVFDSDDIFKALDMLKRQGPGSKMVRLKDKKTLAFTTTPKFDMEEDPGASVRRQQKTRSKF